MQPYAPLGTIYAAALLRQNGFEVKLHDVMFADGPETLEPVLRSFKPDVLAIYDDGFNYLTKMCLTNMREAAFRMCAMGKEHGCTVIVSSSDSTDHFKKYLDHKADYVIAGEAEQTLLELVTSLKRKGDTGSIAGIIKYTSGEIFRTVARPVMHDLDALPFPAWDLVDVEAYRNAWIQKNGYFSMNMGTTRGCPFKCNWCAKPIYGNRYNARSPENVVTEIKQLHQQYHFDHIWFSDDIFGLKPGWVKKFAELVAAERLNFKFKIQSRADLLLNDEQIKPLADAGCEIVWMGAESGSQRILDAMDKGTTIAQIEQATLTLKKHGIKPAFFLQFGYPTETIEDIQLTLDLLEKLVPAEIGISVSYPLPGTRFYENVKTELKEKTNWTDSDELVLMFHNTYKPAFYKQLHTYVHDRFRVIRSKKSLSSSFSFPQLVKLPYYIYKSSLSKRSMNRLID